MQRWLGVTDGNERKGISGSLLLGIKILQSLLSAISRSLRLIFISVSSLYSAVNKSNPAHSAPAGLGCYCVG